MNQLTTNRQPAPVAVSRLGSIITDASTMAAKMEARRVEVARGLYKFHPDKGPTADERRDLSEAIAAINAALVRRTDIDHIDRCEQMLCSVRVTTRDVDIQKAAGAWIVILGDLPRAALDEAVRRILRNEAPDVPERFVPTPDVIARVARSVIAEWDYQKSRAQRLLALQTAVRVVDEPAASVKHREQLEIVRARLRRMRESQNDTAAAWKRSESSSGGEMERLVESVPTGTIYGRQAPASSKAGRSHDG